MSLGIIQRHKIKSYKAHTSSLQAKTNLRSHNRITETKFTIDYSKSYRTEVGTRTERLITEATSEFALALLCDNWSSNLGLGLRLGRLRLSVRGKVAGGGLLRRSGL